MSGNIPAGIEPSPVTFKKFTRSLKITDLEHHWLQWTDTSTKLDVRTNCVYNPLFIMQNS
jgi:hypothetical protein